MRLLFICSANRNRSPMAAAWCQVYLDTARLAGIATSAGLLAPGASAAPGAIVAMQELGIDMTRHRATRLTAEQLVKADLVLCMDRAQLRAAAVAQPSVFERCFTIVDFVRRGLDVGPRSPAQSLADWLKVVGTHRTPSEVLVDDITDAVPDPHGADRDAYRANVVLLDGLIRGVLYLLFAEPLRPLI